MRKILLDTSIHAPQFCSLPQHELLLRAYRIQVALQCIDVDVSVGLAMRCAHCRAARWRVFRNPLLVLYMGANRGPFAGHSLDDNHAAVDEEIRV